MRVAYFLTHPIQYQSPMIRHLRAGGVDVEVIYGTDAGSRAYFDPGFGRQVEWDVPLLDGYPNRVLNREEPSGSQASQIAHYTRQIDETLQGGKFGAIWVHGWWHPLTLAAWSAARRHRLPLMLRGETFAGCIRGGKLKRLLHRLVFSRRFRQVSAFLAVGTLNEKLYRTYGAPADRIFRVPYAVDNAFFQARAAEAKPRREERRARLGIEPGRPVILFCGKLIDVKDPATLIRAMGILPTKQSTINHPPSTSRPVLLLAGDGALRPDLERLASREAPGCVTFLGFQNQTELPALYDLCDVFVLPSVFEPWGLVVNEVMNAGRPVVVSDQVGSGPDLVKPGVNGDIFKAGDADDLVRKLAPFCQNAGLRNQAGQESLALINGWGFDQCLAGVRQAVRHLAAN